VSFCSWNTPARKTSRENFAAVDQLLPLLPEPL
jgi:hypothetical protein